MHAWLRRLPVTKNLPFAVALSMLAACKPAASPPSPAATIAQRPEAIASARIRRGGAICPLEIVNGNPIRMTRAFAAGSRATLVGWVRVADKDRPASPLAYVVFRSAVPDGSADLFWPAKRVARPDISQGDPQLARAGYAASGELPKNPGKYKVLLWVGDGLVQRECDTGELLDLHG